MYTIRNTYICAHRTARFTDSHTNSCTVTADRENARGRLYPVPRARGHARYRHDTPCRRRNSYKTVAQDSPAVLHTYRGIYPPTIWTCISHPRKSVLRSAHMFDAHVARTPRVEDASLPLSCFCGGCLARDFGATLGLSLTFHATCALLFRASSALLLLCYHALSVRLWAFRRGALVV
jgi:hypothetical protein